MFWLKITQIYVCGPAAQTSIYLWSFKPHYFHIFPFRNKISPYFQCQYPTLWWSWCRVTCLYCRGWDRRSPNMILHIINISTILDYKCQRKYAPDPTWRFKIFIVIIFITKSISVLQNLLICCRWLRKHIGHVSDGHFLYYKYVWSSQHVVHNGYQPYWQFITTI